jgi:hypothetical protein
MDTVRKADFEKISAKPKNSDYIDCAACTDCDGNYTPVNASAVKPAFLDSQNQARFSKFRWHSLRREYLPQADREALQQIHVGGVDSHSLRRAGQRTLRHAKPMPNLNHGLNVRRFCSAMIRLNSRVVDISIAGRGNSVELAFLTRKAAIAYRTASQSDSEKWISGD